jgi:hypothetical protein
MSGAQRFVFWLVAACFAAVLVLIATDQPDPTVWPSGPGDLVEVTP